MLGSQVGGEVGYQVRLDDKTGPLTQIIVMTPGVLLKYLQEVWLLDMLQTCTYICPAQVKQGIP